MRKAASSVKQYVGVQHRRLLIALHQTCSRKSFFFFASRLLSTYALIMSPTSLTMSNEPRPESLEQYPDSRESTTHLYESKRFIPGQVATFPPCNSIVDVTRIQMNFCFLLIFRANTSCKRIVQTTLKTLFDT